jgi:hypothetical protein
LKFDTLLAQFLYQHKTLGLPGIGTFTLDSNAFIPTENTKNKVPMEGISFSTKFPVLPEEGLVDFIRTHTGKMKPLAEADLDSFLTLSQQYINIGKPLYLEGIGTLQRVKNDFEFTPGLPTTTRLEPVSYHLSEGKRQAAYEEEMAAETGNSGVRQKLLLTFGILCTVALLGWGSYYLYTKNNTKPPVIIDNNKAALTPITSDTSNNKAVDSLSGLNPASTSTPNKDSIAQAVLPAPKVTIAPGNYKFVIEKPTNKTRALTRYNQLKKNGVDLYMETADSVNFKLYLLLAAQAADTTRLKDSLNTYFNYDFENKRFKRYTTIEN